MGDPVIAAILSRHQIPEVGKTGNRDGNTDAISIDGSPQLC
jgi:hypothetical protein